MDDKSFFSWAFEGKTLDEFIVTAVNKKYKDRKTGDMISYFEANNNDNPAMALSTIEKYVASNSDSYYCLHTFKNNVEQTSTGRFKTTRKANQAVRSRIFGFDVDCGQDKPYANYEDALKVTVPVLHKLGLNKQQYTLVRSGGGLHGYIRLFDFIPSNDWQYLSFGLKRFLLENGLQIDKSKISDPAMLLRPPGSFNFKIEGNPRPVTIIYSATEDILVEDLTELLKDYLDPKASLLDSEPVRVVFDNIADLPESVLSSDMIIAGNVYRPNNLEVQSNCKQMMALAKDADVSEALWYCGIGVASATIDPRASAIAWSKNYAKYNEVEVLKKLDQWTSNTTGPATCAKLADLNPSGCDGCRFKGTVKTPIQTVKAPIASDIAKVSDVFDLPPSYKRQGDQIIRFNEELKYVISDYPAYIIGVARLHDLRKPVTYLKIKVKLPRTGWVEVEMELNALLSTGGKGVDSFLSIMGGIGVAMHKKEMQHFQTYLIDYYKFYQMNKEISKVCTQMGWTEEKTFIYGLKEVRGSLELPQSVTPQGNSMLTIAKAITKQGTKQDWLSAIKMLSVPGLEYQAFGYLLGYGSLIFKFSGLHGATINFYSENTGSGKSTAPRAALSIFGDPKELTGGKMDTSAYLGAKLSSLNNLPAYIDEMSDANSEVVSDLLYAISEGHEKGRADQLGEAKIVRQWSLLLMMSSNKSMYDKLDDHTTSSAGQKARLIELNLPPNDLIDKYGKTLNLLFSENHGHGAIDYINAIVDMNKRGDLSLAVKRAVDEFQEHFDYNFKSEERFIANTLGVTWFAAKIASSLGLCPDQDGGVFNLDRIFKKVLLNIEQSRYKLHNAVETAADAINNMLARNPDQWVKVVKSGAKEQGCAPAGSIFGRIELEYATSEEKAFPTYGKLYMSVEAFKRFCRETKRPYHKFVDEFRTFRNYTEESVNVTKGIRFNVNDLPVTPINIKCFVMDLAANNLGVFKLVNIKGDRAR